MLRQCVISVIVLKVATFVRVDHRVIYSLTKSRLKLKGIYCYNGQRQIELSDKVRYSVLGRALALYGWVRYFFI